MNDDNDDAYNVGFGKPPKGGMFQKGQSGNPKGRPKGVKNFKTELVSVLRSKVTVTVAGKPKSVSVVEAALMRLREKALKGDLRALEIVLGYAEESSNASDAGSRERKLSKLERDILGRSALSGKTDGSEGSGRWLEWIQQIFCRYCSGLTFPASSSAALRPLIRARYIATTGISTRLRTSWNGLRAARSGV